MFKIDLTTQLIPRPSLRLSQRWFERRVTTAVLAGVLTLCAPWGEESRLD
jgi:hypothetical protein